MAEVHRWNAGVISLNDYFERETIARNAQRFQVRTSSAAYSSEGRRGIEIVKLYRMLPNLDPDTFSQPRMEDVRQLRARESATRGRAFVTTAVATGRHERRSRADREH